MRLYLLFSLYFDLNDERKVSTTNISWITSPKTIKIDNEQKEEIDMFWLQDLKTFPPLRILISAHKLPLFSHICAPNIAEAQYTLKGRPPPLLTHCHTCMNPSLYGIYTFLSAYRPLRKKAQHRWEMDEGTPMGGGRWSFVASSSCYTLDASLTVPSIDLWSFGIKIN